MTWGGYCHNEQLIGAEAKWEFVQKHMDGFVMHGMYWINKMDYIGRVNDDVWLKTVQSLGKCLQKYGKTAHVETGHGENEWNYDHNDAKKRAAATQANKDIDMLRLFLKEGVTVSKIRNDWFPTAAATVYAEKFQTTATQELLAMITGADKYWGTVPGFDPAKGNWREYARTIHNAFPGIAFGFDQAPCNFHKIEPDPAIRKLVPWEPLGWGYLSKGLTTMYGKKEVLVKGQPVPLSIDFADLMMSVALSSREMGINFYGFEGDTPYVYVTGNHGRQGQELLPFLLRIERMQHQYGFHNGKILNDCPKTSDEEGFTIDLGKEQEVNRIRVHWGDAFGRKYRFQGSRDGRVWFPLAGIGEGRGGAEELKCKKQSLRWLRCEAKVRGTKNGYMIREVELFGPADPKANLALNKRCSAGSVNPKVVAARKGKKDPKSKMAPELVDGDLATFWESDYINDDAWDKKFHDRTLEYLETYQAAGGRADQYIAESWYPGPYTLFPENKPGTFSNLAKDLIRRIRGINDDGSPMVLDLALRLRGSAAFTGENKVSPTATADQSFRLTPKAGGTIILEAQIKNCGEELNRGDARALPLLRCPAAADPKSGLVFKDATGRDITRQVACTGAYDGWFAGGLEPGQTHSFTVEITPAAAASADYTLELYWNAQDPSLTPRDVFTLKLDSSWWARLKARF